MVEYSHEKEEGGYIKGGVITEIGGFDSQEQANKAKEDRVPS